MAKLYFRYGAMECGKTTQLMQVAYNYRKNNNKVLVCKPQIDKKGGKNISSRLCGEAKVDFLIKPNDTIIDKINYKNLKCILVDESQFLTKEHVRDLWLIAKIYDVPVICYGLKTNFQGNLFEGSKALMEVADQLDELITVCACGKKARFNARKVNGEYTLDGNEVAIDGIEATYEPLCPECYIEKVLKLTKKETKEEYDEKEVEKEEILPFYKTVLGDNLSILYTIFRTFFVLSIISVLLGGTILDIDFDNFIILDILFVFNLVLTVISKKIYDRELKIYYEYKNRL